MPNVDLKNSLPELLKQVNGAFLLRTPDELYKQAELIYAELQNPENRLLKQQARNYAYGLLALATSKQTVLNTPAKNLLQKLEKELGSELSIAKHQLVIFKAQILWVLANNEAVDLKEVEFYLNTSGSKPGLGLTKPAAAPVIANNNANIPAPPRAPAPPPAPGSTSDADLKYFSIEILYNHYAMVLLTLSKLIAQTASIPNIKNPLEQLYKNAYSQTLTKLASINLTDLTENEINLIKKFMEMVAAEKFKANNQQEKRALFIKSTAQALSAELNNLTAYLPNGNKTNKQGTLYGINEDAKALFKLLKNDNHQAGLDSLVKFASEIQMLTQMFQNDALFKKHVIEGNILKLRKEYLDLNVSTKDNRTSLFNLRQQIKEIYKEGGKNSLEELSKKAISEATRLEAKFKQWTIEQNNALQTLLREKQAIEAKLKETKPKGPQAKSNPSCSTAANKYRRAVALPSDSKNADEIQRLALLQQLADIEQKIIYHETQLAGTHSTEQAKDETNNLLAAKVFLKNEKMLAALNGYARQECIKDGNPNPSATVINRKIQELKKIHHLNDEALALLLIPEALPDEAEVQNLSQQQVFLRPQNINSKLMFERALKQTQDKARAAKIIQSLFTLPLIAFTEPNKAVAVKDRWPLIEGQNPRQGLELPPQKSGQDNASSRDQAIAALKEKQASNNLKADLSWIHALAPEQRKEAVTTLAQFLKIPLPASGLNFTYPFIQPNEQVNDYLKELQAQMASSLGKLEEPHVGHIFAAILGAFERRKDLIYLEEMPVFNLLLNKAEWDKKILAENPTMGTFNPIGRTLEEKITSESLKQLCQQDLEVQDEYNKLLKQEGLIRLDGTLLTPAELPKATYQNRLQKVETTFRAWIEFNKKALLNSQNAKNLNKIQQQSVHFYAAHKHLEAFLQEEPGAVVLSLENELKLPLIEEELGNSLTLTDLEKADFIKIIPAHSINSQAITAAQAQKKMVVISFNQPKLDIDQECAKLDAKGITVTYTAPAKAMLSDVIKEGKENSQTSYDWKKYIKENPINNQFYYRQLEVASPNEALERLAGLRSLLKETQQITVTQFNTPPADELATYSKEQLGKLFENHHQNAVEKYSAVDIYQAGLLFHAMGPNNILLQWAKGNANHLLETIAKIQNCNQMLVEMNSFNIQLQTIVKEMERLLEHKPINIDSFINQLDKLNNLPFLGEELTTKIALEKERLAEIKPAVFEKAGKEVLEMLRASTLAPINPEPLARLFDKLQGALNNGQTDGILNNAFHLNVGLLAFRTGQLQLEELAKLTLVQSQEQAKLVANAETERRLRALNENDANKANEHLAENIAENQQEIQQYRLQIATLEGEVHRLSQEKAIQYHLIGTKGHPDAAKQVGELEQQINDNQVLIDLLKKRIEELESNIHQLQKLQGAIVEELKERAKKAEAAARQAEEAKRKAEEDARQAEEAKRIAEEAKRKAEEDAARERENRMRVEQELERLRNQPQQAPVIHIAQSPEQIIQTQGAAGVTAAFALYRQTHNNQNPPLATWSAWARCKRGREFGTLLGALTAESKKAGL